MALPNHESIEVGVRLTDFTTYDVEVENVQMGGIGIVAIGRDRLHSNRKTALKTVHNSLLSANPKIRNMFVREALTWCGIWPHPNILGMYGVTEISDAAGLRPFIVSPYADQGSLRDILRRGHMPFELGLFFAQGIAAALDVLHSPDPRYLRFEPIVHRDIKPENILIMNSGLPVIADFGLAISARLDNKSMSQLSEVKEPPLDHSTDVASQLIPFTLETPHTSNIHEPSVMIRHATQDLRTVRGVALGTPAYMPPEQWRDAAFVGPQADVYSIGLILSELLTGRHALMDLDRPFNVENWRRAHTEDKPRLLRDATPQVSDTFEDLYLACLAKDPAERPSAKDVLLGLQELARELDLQVYEPPEAVAHSPRNEAEFWHNWSNAYVRFGLYSEAYLRNEMALLCARGDPEVLNTRGVILTKRGYFAEAEEAYRLALAQIPSSDLWAQSGTWTMLGVLMEESERYADADMMYQQALELRPDRADTIYNCALNELEWAVNLDKIGQRQTAIEHLDLAYGHAVSALALRFGPARQAIVLIRQAYIQITSASTSPTRSEDVDDESLVSVSAKGSMQLNDALQSYLIAATWQEALGVIQHDTHTLLDGRAAERLRMIALRIPHSEAAKSLRQHAEILELAAAGDWTAAQGILSATATFTIVPYQSHNSDVTFLSLAQSDLLRFKTYATGEQIQAPPGGITVTAPFVGQPDLSPPQRYTGSMQRENETTQP